MFWKIEKQPARVTLELYSIPLQRRRKHSAYEFLTAHASLSPEDDGGRWKTMIGIILS